VAEQETIVITISETIVSTDDEARSLRFPGSPTVRVRGRDVQSEVEEVADFSLG